MALSAIEKTIDQESSRQSISIGKTQILQSREKLAALEQTDRLLEERLDTLKAKDTSGLVVQEKRVQTDINSKKTVLAREKEELKEKKQKMQGSEKKLRQQLSLYQKSLASFLPALTAHATALPFSITPLQGMLDRSLKTSKPMPGFPCRISPIIALSTR